MQDMISDMTKYYADEKFLKPENIETELKMR